MRIFLIIISFILIISLGKVLASPIVLKEDVDESMLMPNYWLKGDATQVLLDPNEILKYNKELQKALPITMVNLADYKNSLDSTTLKKLIIPSNLDKLELYKDNVKLYPKYYENLKLEMNIDAIHKSNSVTFGIVVTRSNLRTYPTTDSVSYDLESTDFDRWQETAIPLGTPVVILHTSKSNKFVYIQMYNYRGWILKDNIATTSKDDWLNYINEYNNDFLVITANHLQLSYNPTSTTISNLQLDMGTKLTLLESKIPELIDNQSTKNNYVVKIPIRKDNGLLAYKLAIISPSNKVHEGYLPFNEENLINQAFKMQGDRYDWGGLHGGRDCSSFVNDIYSVFGIYLPRNTSEQALIPNKVDITESISYTNRQDLIKKLNPGSLLVMEGHVMLYLGSVDGKSYVIQAISSEYPNNNQQFINQVIVSTTDLIAENGETLLQNIKSVIQIGKQIDLEAPLKTSTTSVAVNNDATDTKITSASTSSKK
ncbi:NLP/P60-like protein [Candidatus Hepatincola sp. Pdp]